MKTIGITGQSGFIGTHLTNNLNLFPEQYRVLDFKDEYFEDTSALRSFVKQCDAIVHLAAVNRHEDQSYLYQKNIELGNKLIEALLHENVKPHILFSSSVQEELNNIYGNAKKEVRLNLKNWAASSGASFTAFIIPNVFGPFSNPFYNTVIATFCHQLINNVTPKIITDSEVPLIYVGDLAKIIIGNINSGDGGDDCVKVEPNAKIKVSEILALLNRYKEEYIGKGIIPELHEKFELNLFNTFRSFIDYSKMFPVKYCLHSDERGRFVELAKVSGEGQFSFSTTKPGVTRGNHFHTRKIERFSVINGKALIQLRRIGTSDIINLYLDGDEPAYVDMPIWYTHNITNIGDTELVTAFWINEFYDQADPDTYFEAV